MSFTLSGGSTLKVKWTTVQFNADTTPNDPLDRVGSERYSTWYTKEQGTERIELTKPGTATESTFTGPGPSFDFGVAASNEWSVRSFPIVYARPHGLTTKTPTWVKADSPHAVITGTFSAGSSQVILQARNSSTGAWYPVASRIFHDRVYRYELGAAGSRQYRVLVPNTTDGHWAYFGGYSQIGATTVQINVLGAGFDVPSVRRGETAKAQLYMRPAIVGNAILQRWNGKTWTVVGPVPIANGLGFGYIKGAAPGRVAYRFYLPSGYVKGQSPSGYSNGQWFAAAYTNTFVLTSTD